MNRKRITAVAAVLVAVAAVLAAAAGANKPASGTSTGTGQVFFPNPVAQLQNQSLTDQNDADYAALAPAYVTVTLTDLDGELQIDADGDGFLRNMVRIIAGTLMEVGAGQRSPDTVPAIIAARSRDAAGKTAPPQGLTLMTVRY